VKYNLTEKLKFDEDPVLQIGDEEITVRSDAEVLLSIMDAMQGKGELAAVREACSLIFSEEDQKKLSKMKLKTDDFITVIRTAIALALGEDPDEEDEGEA